MEKNIENIISNFFRNQCDENQLEHLLNFISIENNYNIFNEYVKINHLSNLSMSQFDKASLLQEIEGRIKESKKRSLIKNYIKKSIIVAAVFMGIIGIATFLNNESLIIESENIVLTKSNGEKIIIDTQKIEVDKLEGLVSPKTNTLTYKKDTISKSFVENTIDVPYGKRFKLKLSDGTIVHLNSGSTFTFPVSFIEGMDRVVHLSGEAFFDVARDNLNLFKVYSTGSLAEVYGTKFNFRNYEEDNFSEIILTEGSLGVMNTTDQSEIVIIKPGDKAKVDYSEGHIKLTKVNTVLYTSWIDGRIIFRDESLFNMMRKLERIYNVIIIINNKYLKEVFANATFLTDEESIEDVLEYLKEIYEIDYQIINDKIIIN
jgi:hypothetical protein